MKCQNVGVFFSHLIRAWYVILAAGRHGAAEVNLAAGQCGLGVVILAAGHGRGHPDGGQHGAGVVILVAARRRSGYLDDGARAYKLS